MTRITGTLHKDVGIFILSRSLLLKMRNFSDESCTENWKSNTHSMFSIFIFRKFCRLWDSVGKYGNARQATDNIIRLMLDN